MSFLSSSSSSSSSSYSSSSSSSSALLPPSTGATDSSSGSSAKAKRKSGLAGLLHRRSSSGELTPPPLPQGEPDNGNGNGSVSSSSAACITNHAGIANTNTNTNISSSALLPPPHAVSLSNPRPHLPGVFTVFQGIPGDGMANTIDSSPIMEYHGGTGGSSSHLGSRVGSRAASRAGSRAGSRRNSFNGGNGFNNNSQALLLAAAQATSSLTVTEEGEDDEDEGEDAIVATDSFSSARAYEEEEEEVGVENDDEDEKLEEQASAAITATSTEQQPKGRPRSRSFEAMAALENELHGTTEGGLHLPIPPSMGLSASLPPLVPAPTGNTANTTTSPRIPKSKEPIATSKPSTPSTPRQLVGISSISSPFAVDASASPIISSNGTNLTRSERRAIKAWEVECRERESRQREETLLELRQRQITNASFINNTRDCRPGSAIDTSDDNNSNNNNNNASSSHQRPNQQSIRASDEFPYARNGRLTVFASLPTKDEGCQQVSWGPIQGDLAPGSAVDAVEMIVLDSETLQRVEDTSISVSSADDGECDTGPLRFLSITSPIAGYVLYRKEDGSTLLGCGPPSHWANPECFIWRVCCPDGALIRDGLELTAAHVKTVPHGSFVKVTGKTVNSMGLGRLRVEAVIMDEIDTSSSTDADRNAEAPQTVRGWISEALNPLSGQRGPVVQPLPLPAPIQCRVVYAEGATIRSGVELSSAEVGHAPAGTVLAVVGRAFSEYPTDNCIERLKLAGGAGWISARLNRPPPLDESLVELVGIDDNFDANDPGPYHLKAQSEVMEQTGGFANNGPPNSLVSQATRRLMRTMSTAELSSIHDDDEDEEEDGVVTSGGGGEPYHGTGMTLFRNGMGGGALAMAPPGHEICLICLTDERDATIVHGGTGHIATCLGCARILKARGDNCPVCRLPIDMVIQQFWA